MAYYIGKNIILFNKYTPLYELFFTTKANIIKRLYYDKKKY